MDPGWIVALELVLVLGCVLGLAARELWLLRRDRARRNRADAADNER